MREHSRVPLLKAVGVVFLSLVICNGLGLLALSYWQNTKLTRFHDPRYNIGSLIHSCRGSHPLQTPFLAQLLDLSLDAPSNLYAYDSAKGQQQLLQCGAIAEAVIKKVPPQTLFVSYSLRQPLAYVTDYDNSAIARDGVLFPLTPFHTPKNIPELCFSFTKQEEEAMHFPSQGCEWGQILTGEKVSLAFAIYDMIALHFPFALFTLEKIDLSHAYDPSWGLREVVVVIKESVESVVDGRPTLLTAPRILRLSAESYPQQLANYLCLRDTLNKELLSTKTEMRYWTAPTMIIDMRIAELCIISLPL